MHACMDQATGYDARSRRKLLPDYSGNSASFRARVRHTFRRQVRAMDWCYRQATYYPSHCHAGYKPSPSGYKPTPPSAYCKPCPPTSTVGYKPDMSSLPSSTPASCGMVNGHPSPSPAQHHSQQQHHPQQQHHRHHHPQQMAPGKSISSRSGYCELRKMPYHPYRYYPQYAKVRLFLNYFLLHVVR